MRMIVAIESTSLMRTAGRRHQDKARSRMNVAACLGACPNILKKPTGTSEGTWVVTSPSDRTRTSLAAGDRDAPLAHFEIVWRRPKLAQIEGKLQSTLITLR